MTGRLRVPVDAYMLLKRDGKLLMLRRSPGAAYAAGLLCPPSGHVDEGETVSDAAIREAAEETGVKLAPDLVRCVTVVHHRGPGGQARIGWFFAAASGWDGDPVTRSRPSTPNWRGSTRPTLRRTWLRTRGPGCAPGRPGLPTPSISRSQAARSATNPAMKMNSPCWPGLRRASGDAELGQPGGDPADAFGRGHAGRDVDDVLSDAGAGGADDPVAADCRSSTLAR